MHGQEPPHIKAVMFILLSVLQFFRSPSFIMEFFIFL